MRMLSVKNVIVSGAVAAVVIGVLAVVYVYVPKLFINPEGKYTVLMSGRSVTEQMFRRWELPGILNRLSIWRDWYIPFSEHVDGDKYFQQLPTPSPTTNYNKPGYEYGKVTLDTITGALNKEKYNAMMFELCFVDFRDKSLKSDEDAEQLYNHITSLVQRVHDITKQHNTKLILPDALPVLDPGVHAQQVRMKYNQWVADYEKNNNDVVKLNLFDRLTDTEGKLKREYSIDLSDNDSHLNTEANSILANELMTAIDRLKK